MTAPDPLVDAITTTLAPYPDAAAFRFTDDELRALANQLAPGHAVLALPKLHDRATNCDPAIVWDDENAGTATVLEGINGILPHVYGPLTALEAIRLAAALVATAIRRTTESR